MSYGTLGFSWSIGADSATLARYLGFGGSVVNLELDEYKSRGFSVRCVSVNGNLY